jgi:hypothetical protein
MNVDTPSTIVLIHGRPHLPGAPGWEQVADYALDWALRNRRS